MSPSKKHFDSAIQKNINNTQFCHSYYSLSYFFICGTIMLTFWNYSSRDALGNVNKRYNVAMDSVSYAVCYNMSLVF